MNPSKVIRQNVMNRNIDFIRMTGTQMTIKSNLKQIFSFSYAFVNSLKYIVNILFFFL
jgi:hypothetical protein